MDKQYFQEYYQLERSHWWFQARLIILERFIKKEINQLHSGKKLKILNVGVATGATTEMLQKIGDVTSVEYDSDCCVFLNENVGISAINASFTALPFSDKEFDIVCAFDVLEHIVEHDIAVSEMKRVLNHNGLYIITVPAFQFLWNAHDEINHHIRRYQLKQISNLLFQNNLKIDYKTYFNFWLFFPIVIARLGMKLLPSKNNAESSGSDFEVMNSSKILNAFFYRTFLSESLFIKYKIKLPVGLSILIKGRNIA